MPHPGEARATPATSHGRGECQRALRDALELAAGAGCKEMVWCDPDYSDWPIGERQTIESLSRWAMSHRKLTILAAQFRYHRATASAIRRLAAHLVACGALPPGQPRPMLRRCPSLLLAPGLFALRMVDPAAFPGTDLPVALRRGAATRMNLMRFYNVLTTPFPSRGSDSRVIAYQVYTDFLGTGKARAFPACKRRGSAPGFVVGLWNLPAGISVRTLLI